MTVFTTTCLVGYVICWLEIPLIGGSDRISPELSVIFYIFQRESLSFCQPPRG